jgi:hypothetical protein
MTTTTQHGQITLPTSELRQILAVLDEYTTSDKTRHVMTLAQVRPIIVEQTPNDETPPTALEWQATDSYALVSITQRVQHTLTEPALIDPAHYWQHYRKRPTPAEQPKPCYPSPLTPGSSPPATTPPPAPPKPPASNGQTPGDYGKTKNQKYHRTLWHHGNMND